MAISFSFHESSPLILEASLRYLGLGIQPRGELGYYVQRGHAEGDPLATPDRHTVLREYPQASIGETGLLQEEVDTPRGHLRRRVIRGSG